MTFCLEESSPSLERNNLNSKGFQNKKSVHWRVQSLYFLDNTDSLSLYLGFRNRIAWTCPPSWNFPSFSMATSSLIKQLPMSKPGMPSQLLPNSIYLSCTVIWWLPLQYLLLVSVPLTAVFLETGRVTIFLFTVAGQFYKAKAHIN